MGGRGVKITADTNVLLRTVVADDAEQAVEARALLLQASVVAVPVPVFCEFAWVLKRAYARSSAEIATAIEAFTALDVIATDLPAARPAWPPCGRAAILPTASLRTRPKLWAEPYSQASIAAPSPGCATAV